MDLYWDVTQQKSFSLINIGEDSDEDSPMDVDHDLLDYSEEQEKTPDDVLELFERSIYSTTDISALEMSEEDKIRAMMFQASKLYTEPSQQDAMENGNNESNHSRAQTPHSSLSGSPGLSCNEWQQQQQQHQQQQAYNNHHQAHQQQAPQFIPLQHPSAVASVLVPMSNCSLQGGANANYITKFINSNANSMQHNNMRFNNSKNGFRNARNDGYKRFNSNQPFNGRCFGCSEFGHRVNACVKTQTWQKLVAINGGYMPGNFIPMQAQLHGFNANVSGANSNTNVVFIPVNASNGSLNVPPQFISSGGNELCAGLSKLNLNDVSTDNSPKGKSGEKQASRDYVHRHYPTGLSI